jgi:hypothetical protein
MAVKRTRRIGWRRRQFNRIHTNQYAKVDKFSGLIGANFFAAAASESPIPLPCSREVLVTLDKIAAARQAISLVFPDKC